MIPEVHVKKEETRHQCLECSEKIETGSLMMLVQQESYFGETNIRQMHFDCFARKNAKELSKVLNKKYLRGLVTQEL